MERIKKQNLGIFHGGKTPDACDFRVYALVARTHHTFMLKQILADREDRQF